MADVESRAMTRIVLDTVALPTYAETCCKKRQRHVSAHARSDDRPEDAIVKREVNNVLTRLFCEEPGRLNKEVSADIISYATGRTLVQMQ